MNKHLLPSFLNRQEKKSGRVRVDLRSTAAASRGRGGCRGAALVCTGGMGDDAALVCTGTPRWSALGHHAWEFGAPRLGVRGAALGALEMTDLASRPRRWASDAGDGRRKELGARTGGTPRGTRGGTQGGRLELDRRYARRDEGRDTGSLELEPAGRGAGGARTSAVCWKSGTLMQCGTRNGG
jgi:hypothetical protein